jgi:flavodoxin
MKILVLYFSKGGNTRRLAEALMDATGHYGVSCVGKPDEKNLEHSRLHGKRVAELAIKVKL